MRKFLNGACRVSAGVRVKCVREGVQVREIHQIHSDFKKRFGHLIPVFEQV